jgi:rod shape-determining protein MreC
MSTNRDDFSIAIRSALLQRGAAQKFSLFFLLSISIIIFFLDRYPSNFMDRVRGLLNDGIYTVSSVSTSPFKLASHLTNKTTQHFFVYEENRLLKKELEILRKKNLNVNFLEIENKKLQESIDSTVKSNLSKPDFLLAKVMLDKESPFLKSLILNKGSNAGVRKGMPVLSKGYLIGRIVEVNFFSSRVLLLNDLNSRIPLVIEPNGIQGILTGVGTDTPRINYLPEVFNIENSKKVYTSGIDGVLPGGIPVGTISILNDNIFVKLFSDPNQLSFVNIILTELKRKNF